MSFNIEGKKPSQTPLSISDKTPRYLVGSTLNYRFNAAANNGFVNYEGDTSKAITAKEETFSLCPLAYRVFFGRKFNRDRAVFWAELFFLNERAQLCTILFNNISAERFLQMTKILYYDELDISQIRLTVRPKVKTSKTSSNDYYACDFGFEELTNEERLINQRFIEELGEIYRYDTFEPTDNLVSETNYSKRLAAAHMVYSPMVNTEPAFEIADGVTVLIPEANTKALLKKAA